MTHAALRTALSELGLTPSEFAALCGVTRETVFRWMRDPESNAALPVPRYAATIVTLLERIGGKRKSGYERVIEEMLSNAKP